MLKFDRFIMQVMLNFDFNLILKVFLFHAKNLDFIVILYVKFQWFEWGVGS